MPHHVSHPGALPNGTISPCQPATAPPPRAGGTMSATGSRARGTAPCRGGGRTTREATRWGGIGDIGGVLSPFARLCYTVAVLHLSLAEGAPMSASSDRNLLFGLLALQLELVSREQLLD